MSDHTWIFISDLHLSDATPHTLEAFERFVASMGQEGTHLVILGDLFEAWIGDDDSSECISRVKQTLISARACGAHVYFMHGNRDFLIGDAFLDETGVDILPDPYIMDLFGTDTLLTHGDSLCTDDVPYQEFRRQSRDDTWQANFLAQPLDKRKQIARGIRQESERSKAIKSADIMDVNQQTVLNTLAGRWPDGTYIGPVPRIVHGHTHRPDTHTYPGACKGRDAVRLVLSDWDFDNSPKRGSYLVISDQGSVVVPVVSGR